MYEGDKQAGIKDPAKTDTTLSQQMGGAILCPGPVVFPMASGSNADALAQEFGYPLESQTGNIDLGSQLTELKAKDPASQFMLDVYDEIIAAKGGEGSEEAAAFLTNFMPTNSQLGDERKHYFKLVYGDEVVSRTTSALRFASTSTEVYNDGELSDITDPMFNLFGNEIIISVSPKQITSIASGFYYSSETALITAKQAAEQIIQSVETTNQVKPYLDWLFFGANVLLITVGVGAAVGTIRVAATVGARLVATTVLAFEVSEGASVIHGFIGGKKEGYNPIKEAFKWTGKSADGANGAQMAEHIYNTLNIVVGFGGKIGLLGGSLYASTQLPTACQPAEGELKEQTLESQVAAQKTVF